MPRSPRAASQLADSQEALGRLERVSSVTQPDVGAVSSDGKERVPEASGF
jgi:hypothetical protein